MEGAEAFLDASRPPEGDVLADYLFYGEPRFDLFGVALTSSLPEIVENGTVGIAYCTLLHRKAISA